jgi:hypothetical protein
MDETNPVPEGESVAKTKKSHDERFDPTLPSLCA